jgi:hypothetical protein
LPMFPAILTAIMLLPITMLHLHNTMGTIRRRITTSWANNVTPMLAMFGLGLLPPAAGEAQLFLISPNNLHLSGPQVSTCLIHSNVTVNASHNLSDSVRHEVPTIQTSMEYPGLMLSTHAFLHSCL